MSKITLANGIVLNPDGHWAVSLTEYAHSKGFSKIFAFLAENPDELAEYLLVEYPFEGKEGTPIYSNTNFEAWADKNLPG